MKWYIQVNQWNIYFLTNRSLIPLKVEAVLLSLEILSDLFITACLTAPFENSQNIESGRLSHPDYAFLFMQISFPLAYIKDLVWFLCLMVYQLL